jgi:stage II sporulation protein AA (anti-sigma F factor antagonist)
MTIVNEMLGGTLVFRLVGRLDSTNARDFEQQLLAALDDGADRVVIDLSALEYISSAGLRVVLLAGKHLGERGGRLALSSVRPSVNEVFRISGFLGLFAFYATADDAVAALD